MKKLVWLVVAVTVLIMSWNVMAESAATESLVSQLAQELDVDADVLASVLSRMAAGSSDQRGEGQMHRRNITPACPNCRQLEVVVPRPMLQVVVPRRPVARRIPQAPQVPAISQQRLDTTPIWQQIAAELDLEPGELREKLAAGEKLLDLLEKAEITPRELMARMRATFVARMQAQEAAGRVDPRQARARLQELGQAMEALMSRLLAE